MFSDYLFVSIDGEVCSETEFAGKGKNLLLESSSFRKELTPI